MKDCQKNAGKRYQNLSKEEKEKKKQYGPLNVAKVSQKMKMKSLVSIEKMLQNDKKCDIIIIRKFFNLEKIAPL